MPDLKTTIAEINLNNPTILASGVLGVTAASLARVSGHGAGAVTMKSIGPRKRSGHPTPVMVEVPGGLLNAVGLCCPSLDESVAELSEAVRLSKSPVIASIYGTSVDEFAHVASNVCEAKPALLEANISCPNVEAEFGKPFASDPKIAANVTAAIKESSDIPLIVKLSPNVPDIAGIAGAVEDAGADAICAINTVGPGMKIDIDSGRPVLSNRFGGLSGPAIKPLMIRCVYQIYERVRIPVIATGGISTWQDAVEAIFAGATAVGVGTAIMEKDLDVFSQITEGLSDFMEERGISCLKDMRGKAHAD